MVGKTIPARLLQQAQIRPNEESYYVREKSGNWKATTWKSYAEEATAAAQSLLALGLNEGSTATILGFNKPEWVLLDVAAMMIGGIAAGIYTTCSPEEVQYIIHHAESPVVLLEDKGQWEKVLKELPNLPFLKHVVMMRGCEKIEHEKVMTWEEFLAKGKNVDKKEVFDRVERLTADQLATFIYTSGTTGPPKAVMLSHENLAWTAQEACDLIGLVSTDSSVSYLPLSHIAEQVFTIHAPITAGSKVYFAESIDKLKDNLVEVQPTIMFGVPRIWEKMHAGIEAKLKLATGFKAKLVAWARGVGSQVTALKNSSQEPGLLLGLQYSLANKLIFSKLKVAIGLSKIRVAVSGAAPIAPEVLQLFGDFDLTIHEVYGQSEDTGPTSFNVPGRTKYGTVGPAFPGVDIKIAEDDEILVKGPNVFKGYYKDGEATKETLIDGWLYSGDLGAFDSDGFLKITGRKKDIIITAGGKNIAPKNIESSLKNQELIGDAVVIGDRRKFLSALITMDDEAVAKFAEEHQLPKENLNENPKILEVIQEGVNKVNQSYARVEHIRKFKVLPRNFSIEAGELTPTLKIKRNVINKLYSEVIESMYEE